jgi:hypothetical protein
MKTKNEKIKWIVLVMIIFMSSGAIYAQKGEISRNHDLQNQQQITPTTPFPLCTPLPPTPPPVPDADQDGLPPRLDLPGMTDEQKGKIDKLMLKQMESMTPLKNQVHEKKARLATILTTMPVDLNAADKVADDLGKIQSEILKLMIRNDQALRNVLTPDQQVIFDSRPKPFLRRK